MIELKPYQSDFVNDDKFITIGDFSRQLGKTFSLAYIIMKFKPEKCLYMNGKTPKNISCELLYGEIKKIGGFMCVNMNDDSTIEIKHINGSMTKVYVKSLKSEYIFNDYNMLLFDDMLPLESIFNHNVRKVFSTITCDIHSIRETYRTLYSCSIKEYGISYCKKEYVKKLYETLDKDTFRRQIDITGQYKEDKTGYELLNTVTCIEKDLKCMLNKLISIEEKIN